MCWACVSNGCIPTRHYWFCFICRTRLKWGLIFNIGKSALGTFLIYFGCKWIEIIAVDHFTNQSSYLSLVYVVYRRVNYCSIVTNAELQSPWKTYLEIPHHSNNILLHFQPKSTDRVTQQIQSKLGNFSNVRELLEEPKRLIGLDAAAQSPAPPDLKKASSSSQHHRYKEPPPPSSSSGGGHSSSSNRHPPPPAPAPPHQHSPKLNGVPKPFTFSRPASKGLSKLDGTAVSVGAVFQKSFDKY